MRLALLSRRRLVKYLSQRQVQLSQVESAAAVIVELVKENVGRPHLRADPQAVDEALTKFDLAHPALALLVPELDEILGLELALEDGEPHACRHGAAHSQAIGGQSRDRRGQGGLIATDEI
jgi:hypothetical protein